MDGPGAAGDGTRGSPAPRPAPDPPGLSGMAGISYAA